VLKEDDEGDDFSGFDNEYDEFMSMMMNFNVF